MCGTCGQRVKQKNGLALDHPSKAAYDPRTAETVAPFRGTAFGVYNAVTEYLDHVAPLAGAAAKAEGEEAAIKRAQRTLMSNDLGDMKAKAFTALLPV